MTGTRRGPPSSLRSLSGRDVLGRDSPTMRLSDTQRIAWLRLIRTENIGPRTFRSLINHCGGAEAALEALPRLTRKAGAGKAPRIVSREDAEREIEAGRKIGVRFVALGEPDYPAVLRAVANAPPVISVRGHLPALSQPAVAIVGSRNASAAGLAMAERLARGLGENGYCVISGLARGIDGRAHRASLATGTIAVLAGGQDRIYPAENAGLAGEILERGMILSEMPLGWEARGRDFPRRNRIVAGLSLATVVIEAARRSGSLITANFANEQGRIVMAVPGHPLDPRAEGPNDLLAQGATICRGIEDVLEAVSPLAGGPRQPDLFAETGGPSGGTGLFWDELDLGLDESGPPPDFAPHPVPAARETGPDDELAEKVDDDPRMRLLDLLGPAAIGFDDLIRQAGLSASAARPVLMELELEGRIVRLDGGRVARINP